MYHDFNVAMCICNHSASNVDIFILSLIHLAYLYTKIIYCYRVEQSEHVKNDMYGC